MSDSKKFALQPDVKFRHLAAHYYGSLWGLCLFTLIGALQPFVLTSILQVPLAEQGRVTGRLGFFQEITVILTIGLLGVFSDKIGRMPVYAFGFLTLGIAYFLYPSATSVEQLIFFRTIAALGMAAITVMFTTVTADYVMDSSRGKATGWQGIFNGLGAILTSMLFLKMPEILEKRAGMSFVEGLQTTFYIAAGIAVISALIMIVGLKKGVAVNEIERKSFLTLAREGIAAARLPGVRLAYAAAFVSRGDMALVGQFLIVWLNKYGLEKAGLNESQSLVQAQIAFVIVQLAAFFSAPVIGYLSDKMNRALAVAICVGISAVGYSSLFLMDNPLGWQMKIALILVGIGEMAGMIASQTLIANQAPKEIRGSVMGVFSFCGALGILLAFTLGGYLFDHWRESAPFLLFGVLGAFVALWGFTLSRSGKFQNSYE